jgi:Flp pilus assembly protein TadG
MAPRRTRLASDEIARAGHAGSASRQGGQSLVEFSLVLPLFLLLVISLVEFAFVFNAILATNYAARDAALLAAEAGSDAGADCSVLRGVEADLGAPADRSQIRRVEIFETTPAGDQVGSATIYARTGSTGCTLPDGTSVVLPYSRTADGYPVASRCNVLAGCSGAALDHVGVRVVYRHTWKTPFGTSFGSFLDVVKSNSMRMEPVL